MVRCLPASAGFDLGLERAGLTTAWQVEVDPFCNQLLRSKWPDVERHEDVREFSPDGRAIDVISGGFPCQDVSIAGRREGLAGERSGLWFEFHRVLELARPRWAIIENVPGLLSSNGGRDFAVILRGLADLGYCVAYRILDAQFFGVPQRRRRVFIVGCLGGWGSVEVLFEPDGLSGDPPPGKETGEKVAGTLGSNSQEGFRTTDLDQMGSYIWQWASGGGDDPKETAQALRAEAEHSYQVLFEFHGQDSWIREHADVAPTLHRKMGTGGNNTPLVSGSVSPKWRKGTGGPAGDEAYNLVAAPLRSRQAPNSNMPGRGGEDDQNLVVGDGVRRLTPLECERLQGFPDGWTSEFSDSRRYRMIGNAVAVPVAEWLGHRLRAVDA